MSDKKSIRIGIYMKSMIAAIETEMMVFQYFSKKEDEPSFSTRVMTKREEVEEALSWYDILFYQMDSLYCDYRETLRYIYQYNGHVVTIFVTRMFDYDFMNQSQFGGLYLWKPMTKNNFGRTLDEGIARLKEAAEPCLVCDTEEGQVRVSYGDILYLESYYRKVYLHLTPARTYTINGTLNELAEKLEDDSRFLRIHQSYLINMQHIIRNTYEKVELSDGRELSISAGNRPMVRKKIKEYLE